MFFTYLRRELRGRMRQAVFIALGLPLVVGVGIGFLGAELVSKFSHKLTATVGTTTGSATPGGARQFGFPGSNGTGTRGFPGGGGGGGGFGAAARNAAAANHTVTVHLTPAVSGGIILLAVVLAVAGGIIAGMFGGWRAARLRPADALSKVG